MAQYSTFNAAGPYDFIAKIDQLALHHQSLQCYLAQVREYYQTALNGSSTTLHLWRGVELAKILLSLGMDGPSLQAALLFPLAESTMINLHTLQTLFGQEVTQLIQGVLQMDALRHLHPNSTVNRLPFSSAQIRNIRHMLLTMIKDLRCVVIKLAERVVQLRAAKTASGVERIALAQECIAIYAPLANRLGIGQLKWALEDFSLRYQQPQTYQAIASMLQARRIDREHYIAGFVAHLKEQLLQLQVSAQIEGRAKHICSIWHKMQQKSLSFDKLFDVLAVRIIVSDVATCYAVLGFMHSHFHVLMDEFSDYIAHPKANGYRSIHTVIMDVEKKVIEVQIRTQQMHQAAEWGVAAHWKYKAGGRLTKRYEQRMAWLKLLLAWCKEGVGHHEWSQALRCLGFDQWIYLFTPQGDIIELPGGARPLDFAYRIHTEIGHRCIGAKVNGRMVPLTYPLCMGEQVEIITQKQPHPCHDWLDTRRDLVKTKQARYKIRSAIRKLSAISPLIKAAPNARDKFMLQKRASFYLLAGKVHTNCIVIDGINNMQHAIAGCCKPIQGDKIVGFITQRRGISVHRESCRQLEHLRLKAAERLVAAYYAKSGSKERGVWECSNGPLQVTKHPPF